MRLTNHYYNVYKKSKPLMRENTDSEKASRVIKHAKKEDDLLEVIKFDVIIEEEWIIKIEEGLIFVEKAILEDRRFIRHEGDVLLIEKVKKTSRESIEHLSRNTGFITRKPEEGDNLVPDKLYIVEKLHDYAVYENRFLYLLLSYLRDFLYQRLEKITNKLSTYKSKLTIKKEIKIKNRSIDYYLDVHDLYKNDPYLSLNYKNNKLIERMELAYYFVESLLRTDLMKEVSKSPMLKPPIVKTNVLRMNPNFKEAVSLYDYIMAYTKDGYKFSEIVNKYNPFDEKLADDFAYSVELQTFISYKYGNNIEKTLEAHYLSEEERLKKLKDQQELEEIKVLRRRVKELNLDFEEYILLLEKRNNKLEKELLAFNDLKSLNIELEQDILRLNNNILDLENTKVFLEKNIAKKELEIINLIEKHDLEIIELNNNHEEEIENINTTYLEEIEGINFNHLEEVKALEKNHLNEINNLKEQNNLELNILKDKHLEAINEKNVKIKSISDNYEKNLSELKIELLDSNNLLENERTNYNLKIDNLSYEKDLFKAKYFALNKTDLEPNFTTKEGFRELESIRKSFNKYFKEQWKLTKVKIKENVKLESEELLKEELLNKKNKKK